MICLREKLQRLFSRLFEWRSNCPFRDEISSCDRLAIISLKISCALQDDVDLAKTIGQHLSLIIDEPSYPSAHDQLLTSFFIVEKNLEINLRGFSALMDSILEEGKIRYDQAAILNQIDGLDVLLNEQFCSLVTTLETYCELDEAFSLNMPKVAALIFLIKMTEIHALLSGNEKNIANSAIARWLKIRSKNMVLLYDEAMGITGVSPFTTEVLKKKELFLVRLCFMAAESEPVKDHDVVFFDRMLNKMGMLGLKPFVDAGFLAISMAGNEINGKKIFKELNVFSDSPRRLSCNKVE